MFDVAIPARDNDVIALVRFERGLPEAQKRRRILLGAGPVAAEPPSVGDGIEQYRSHLRDVDRTLASVQALRASAAAGDVAGARRAWIEARVGWERSEVFTPFAPELDRDIDAWPDGATGFHAIEAKLFGAGRTDFDNEADRLVRNLEELRAKARSTPLTPPGLLDGIARLAYEVGESKVDGGESRVSGTSLNDVRNNVDGIGSPCVNDPRALLRYRRHHGGQWFGATMGDDSQHRHGLGADTTRRHHALGNAVLDIQPSVLAFGELKTLEPTFLDIVVDGGKHGL